MVPKKIKVIDNTFLFILWDNGKEGRVKLMVLRRECPCAVCKAEQEEESSSFIPVYSTNQVTISEIKPSGTYGIRIAWQDGHDTGIYEYSSLYKLTVNS